VSCVGLWQNPNPDNSQSSSEHKIEYENNGMESNSEEYWEASRASSPTEQLESQRRCVLTEPSQDSIIISESEATR